MDASSHDGLCKCMEKPDIIWLHVEVMPVSFVLAGGPLSKVDRLDFRDEALSTCNVRICKSREVGG